MTRLYVMSYLVIVCIILLGCSSTIHGAQNSWSGPDPPPNLSAGEKYALQDKDVVRVYKMENASNLALGFSYNLDDPKHLGVETLPTQRFIFEVPTHLVDSDTIDRIWIVHRQAKEDKAIAKKILAVKGTPDYNWDTDPAYHVIKCRDINTNTWKVWRGPRYFTQDGEPREYKDPMFDERRYAPLRDHEKETPLFDHLDGAQVYLGKVKCDLIMIENASPNKPDTLAKGRLHGLRVDYQPFAPIDDKLDQEKVFSPSTIFSNLPDHPLPHFGGGLEITPTVLKQQKSIYPFSKILNSTSTEIDRINGWLAIKNGGLVIRLRSGKNFSRCEVAIGNTQYDSKLPVEQQVSRDGWVGNSGNTKVYASLRVAGDANATQVMWREWGLDHVVMLQLTPSALFPVPYPFNPAWTYGGAFIRLDIVGDPVHLLGVRCQYYHGDTPKLSPAGGANAGSQVNVTVNMTDAAHEHESVPVQPTAPPTPAPTVAPTPAPTTAVVSNQTQAAVNVSSSAAAANTTISNNTPINNNNNINVPAANQTVAPVPSPAAQASIRSAMRMRGFVSGEPISSQLRQQIQDTINNARFAQDNTDENNKIN